MNRTMMRMFVCLVSGTLFLLPAACSKKKQEEPAPVENAEQQDQAAENDAAGDEHAADEHEEAKDDEAPQNMYGGPIYNGDPALDVTAALVKAGGGAEDFDFSKALVSMLGEDTVNAEVAKLTEQYGEDEVKVFVNGMTYAVNKALEIAGDKGIELPEPADLEGVELAKKLVEAGKTEDGTWWSGYLFDIALSHDIHNLVMADINQNPDLGHDQDKIVHKILNQAMYDVAQALDYTDVKLADLH